MRAETDLHPVQFEILKFLLFKCASRFSQLNTLDLPTDHFNFHLKALVTEGLVEKKGEKYDLTIKGKEFANRLDTESDGIEKQAKVSVLIVCISKGKYLVQQRLKQPYFGYYGFFGGKIKYGDTPLETAKRELVDETGLTVEKMVLVSLKHKMDYSKTGELLEDKYFFIFRAEGIKGKLIEEFEGGKNLWLTKSEILKLLNLFDGVDTTLSTIDQKQFSYIEKKYKVSGF
jgi:8-oxo-dGTP pyrophosphatase MutT (NUDIX family)